MKPNKRATILDIAEMAQVSTATVSRVLNDVDYPVSAELRKRVLAIAKDLDYRPNIFSQMLKGHTSKEIGVVVPSITNPFYAQLVSDVEKQCIEAGYVPIICSSYNSAQLEQNHMDMLQRQQVAGVLLSTINSNSAFVGKLNSLSVPCVLFDQFCEKFEGSSVTFHFQKGGYLATRYLLDMGHKRIAFASPPLDRASRKLIYKGYREALHEQGLRVSGKHLLIAPKAASEKVRRSSYESGVELAGMLLEETQLPDAILAVNDIVAIGLINALSERKIRIPYDVSILGFDDISFASMITPALTTVRQSTKKTAELAVSILTDQIKNEHMPPRRVAIEPELVERESVRKKYPK